MESEVTKIETTSANVEKVRTKLKFIKSERNGAFISFVSQNPVNGVICGVRQDAPYPKKIVIIDREMSNEILVNVLYECTIIPMTKTLNPKTGEMHVPGYIAIDAKPVQFKATITTHYVPRQKYRVEVSFGNKTIRFDPFRGNQESMKSLPACRAILEKRCDVQDLLEVVESFTHAANNLLSLMEQDMRTKRNKSRR